MANTTIQLKYSDVTSEPTSLANGEVAYSNSSNKLWVGQSNGVVAAIGGKYYTALIDAATSANTASAIVKRDANGNFTAATITANVTGNATTATTLKTARDIGLAGDATGNVSFDGSANVTLTVDLSDTGVSAGTYGNNTTIPVFTVDVEGRISSVTNTAISVSSALSIAGDSGTDTVTVGTDTLTFEGGDGVTSTVTNNKASFAVDNTVLRTSGTQTISGDLTVANLGVTGNLTVAGTYVTQDVANVSTEDPLIQLAANNTANLVDIGLFGQANTGSSIIYTALFRDATDGKYRLLTDGTELPTSTVNVTAFSTATLVADLETLGNVTVRGTNLLDKSNTTLTLSQAAFDKANTANIRADASFAQANSNYISAVTRLDVTHSGSSAYLIDQYSGNNPAVYVTAGETIAFYLNNVTGHPFMIRLSSGGANYNTGLIHVATDGTVSTEANAQSKVSGTLYWKVPAVLAGNTYVYQCSNHSGMVGNINLGRPNSALFDFANAAFAQANTDATGISATAGVYGSASIVPVFSLEANGRVSAVTNTTIAIGASAITSGTLGVTRGGTGFASYTANGVIFGGLTSTSALLSVASSTEGHVLQINASGVPSLAHLSGGSF